MKNITLQKFLVTLDGSKLASAAVPYANIMAARLDAELLLLRVVETVAQQTASLTPVTVPPAIASPGLNATKIARKIVKEKITKAKAELEGLKTSLEDNCVRKVSTIVKQGSASSTIVETAKRQKCDLIFISTHGRSGLGRALLGSVADYVIRHAPCPVLVVHPRRNRK